MHRAPRTRQKAFMGCYNRHKDDDDDDNVVDEDDDGDDDGCCQLCNNAGQFPKLFQSIF